MKKITLFMLIVFTIASQAQNKLLSSIRQNNAGGNWENYSGINYEYDSNNNLITETTLEWVAGVWKNKEKVTYTYDVNNKVVLELGQDWDAVTSTWKDNYKDTYTYASGKFTGRTGEVWNGSAWINETKLELFYNNNLPDYALSYEWNGGWDLLERTSVTYASGKVSTEIIEEWNGSQWVNSEKSTYTHNAGKLVKDTGSDWNGSIWNDTETTDYVLDGTGNRRSETYIFSTTNNLTEYAYETSSLMSSYAHPFKDKTGIDYLTEDFPYVNKVLSCTQKWYNTSAGGYVNNYRIDYNYNSSISLSTADQERVKSAITVSPNPTASVLNINVSNDGTIDKVVVTDVTGRIVLQQNQDMAQINVEKLTAGLYIVEAYSGNEKFTAKFVKK